MLVFISGPYRATENSTVAEHIDIARTGAIALWQAGHVALCPHLNTANFEEDCNVDDETFLAGDLNMLSRCDAICLLPNWEKSAGARGEYEYARDHGIPVYSFPN